MNVAVVYCYPLVNSRTYLPLAQRFVATWQQYPPRTPHQLHVMCNGGPPGAVADRLFAPLSAAFHPRENTGWDIGAFQMAAELFPADLMVYLGAPVHFHQPDWLERMIDAYVENGPHLYGCWAYLSPNWHVRTTVFWCHPELLRSYPSIIGSSRASRYDFEHGAHSFTRHVLSLGLECIMVTRQGAFPFSQWLDHAPGVADSLCLDQHTHL